MDEGRDDSIPVKHSRYHIWLLPIQIRTMASKFIGLSLRKIFGEELISKIPNPDLTYRGILFRFVVNSNMKSLFWFAIF